MIVEDQEFTILLGKTMGKFIAEVTVHINRNGGDGIQRLYFTGAVYYDQTFNTEECKNKAIEAVKELKRRGEWERYVSRGWTKMGEEEFYKNLVVDDWQSILPALPIKTPDRYAVRFYFGDILSTISPSNFTEDFNGGTDVIEFIYKSWREIHVDGLDSIPIAFWTEDAVKKLLALKKYQSSIADYEDGC